MSVEYHYITRRGRHVACSRETAQRVREAVADNEVWDVDVVRLKRLPGVVVVTDIDDWVGSVRCQAEHLGGEPGATRTALAAYRAAAEIVISRGLEV